MVLGDHFLSNSKIYDSVSCFSFYTISIKLHFLSSLMILFSDSARCLLSFSQRVFRMVASWQAAFTKLLSCHIAASFSFTMGSLGPEKDRGLEESAIESRVGLQILHQ